MKLSKESVDYSPGHRGSRCGICRHFLGHGVCEIVAGRIDPQYWCKKFSKRRSSRARRLAEFERKV